MVDDGKEVRDKSGVHDDDVSKLGLDVEEVSGGFEEKRGVNVVKSNLESGVGSEKVKEKCNVNEGENGENKEGVREVASDDVEVNVDDNMEELDMKGGQSDQVPELKGADMEEVVIAMRLSDASEHFQELADNCGKEVGQEQTSEVDVTEEFQQLDKPIAQEGTDTQDAQVLIDDTPTVAAEHSAIEEFQQLEEPVLHEGTVTRDAQVQINNPPTVVAEHSATEEFQQLEEPILHERTVTQDAEIQIDDAATGMTEHKME